MGRQALGKDHRNTLLFANNLAEVYIHLTKYEEAAELLEENIPISRRAFGPTSSRTNSLIGKIMTAYASLNRHEDARPWAVEAIEAQKRRSVDSPSDPTAHNNYAWILLTCEPADLRDPETALEAATRANELTNYQSDSFLDTLAMAYFKNGFVDKAIETHLGGFFDQGVHADRLRSQRAHEPKSGPKIVAVDVGQGNRLENAQRPRLGGRGDQLGIATWVHGATNQRHFGPRVAKKRRPGFGPCQRADWVAGRGARRQIV